MRKKCEHKFKYFYSSCECGCEGRSIKKCEICYMAYFDYKKQLRTKNENIKSIRRNRRK